MDTYTLYHIEDPSQVYVVTATSWDDAKEMVLAQIKKVAPLATLDPKDLFGRKHQGRVLKVSATPLFNDSTS